MSYVRIIAKRDDGLEVEFEIEELRSDRDGQITADNIRKAADKAIAAIVSKAGPS